MPEDTPARMQDPIDAVLADLLELAGQHDWNAVTAFTDTLPAADDPTVLLLASGADDLADDLARRLDSGTYGCEVATAPLESVTADPGAALQAHRALVVLPCGRLLNPETVAAAATVLRRPQATTRIVLAGAEALQGPDDLELVQRGVWRMLLAGTDVNWAGKDLAEHGCLLWGDASGELPDFLRPRLTRDHELLRQWLLTSAADAPGLLRWQRARRALDLAEQAVADQVPQPARGKEPARQVSRLRDDLSTVLRRRLKRLEEDRGSLERQTTASLNMLEQDLLRGADGLLAGQRDRAVGRTAVQALVDSHVDQALLDWLSVTGAAVRDRTVLSDAETRDLLEDVDWTAVNALITDDAGPYPQALLDGARFEVHWEALADELSPARAARPGGLRRSPVSRGGVVGGAIGVVVTIALIGSVPAAIPIGGVAGAVGGHALDGYRAARESDRLTEEYARRQVPQRVAAARAAVREQLQRASDRTARAAEIRFDALDRALRAASAQSPAPAVGRPHGAEQQLLELHRRLDAARPA
ncbi:hypothetical protein ACWGI0_05970 [Streptomyces sp. NPDC054802]